MDPITASIASIGSSVLEGLGGSGGGTASTGPVTNTIRFGNSAGGSAPAVAGGGLLGVAVLGIGALLVVVLLRKK